MNSTVTNGITITFPGDHLTRMVEEHDMLNHHLDSTLHGLKGVYSIHADNFLAVSSLSFKNLAIYSSTLLSMCNEANS
jgi:hypothetical protein